MANIHTLKRKKKKVQRRQQHFRSEQHHVQATPMILSTVYDLPDGVFFPPRCPLPPELCCGSIALRKCFNHDPIQTCCVFWRFE